MLPQTRKPPDALVIDVEQFGDAPPVLAGALLARRRGIEKFMATLHPALSLPPEVSTSSLMILRLPPAMTLRRTLILPAKTERYLKSVIGFELDRLTPFSADEVFWSISGLTRHKDRLKFCLSIVPRSIAAPLFTVLTQMRLKPLFLEVGSDLISTRSLNPLPMSPSPMQRAWVGLCCTLAIIATFLPLGLQQWRLEEVNHQLTVLAPELRELTALKRDAQLANAGLALIAAARGNGDALQILAALTEALPNGTWLSRLSMTPGHIILMGKSDDAARLIIALTAASDFHNPNFVGAVNQLDGKNVATFTIRAATSP
jgi:general secretion pathway protein L